MRFLFLLALAGSTIAAKAPETDALAKHGLDQLWLDVAKHPKNYSKNCTKRTVARRREWYEIDCSNVKPLLTRYRSNLKRSEKLNYIDAVQCTGRKNAGTPAAIAAGAKSRYDDFVVTHILLTQYTHGNV
jgi:tyrosinase